MASLRLSGRRRALWQIGYLGVAITTSTAAHRLSITDAALAARSLDAGAVVGHGFAYFSAITTRADPATVRRVSLMQGRPPGRVDSITAPPAAIRDVRDFGDLPPGMRRGRVLRLIDTSFSLGPFGFRGRAAAHRHPT